VLLAPLTGAAVGALLGGAGTAAAVAAVGIGDDFVREVEGLMKPGTSALFVLDSEGDMEVILHAIRGLGGTVLRTNVDLERAKLIQSTLAAAAAATSKARDVGAFSPQLVQIYLIWSRIQPHSSQLVTSSGIRSSCGMPVTLSVWAQGNTEKGRIVFDMTGLTGLALVHHWCFIFRISCGFRGPRTHIVIIVFPTFIFLE